MHRAHKVLIRSVWPNVCKTLCDIRWAHDGTKVSTAGSNAWHVGHDTVPDCIRALSSVLNALIQVMLLLCTRYGNMNGSSTRREEVGVGHGIGLAVSTGELPSTTRVITGSVVSSLPPALSFFVLCCSQKPKLPGCAIFVHFLQMVFVLFGLGGIVAIGWVGIEMKTRAQPTLVPFPYQVPFHLYSMVKVASSLNVPLTDFYSINRHIKP